MKKLNWITAGLLVMSVSALAADENLMVNLSGQSDEPVTVDLGCHERFGASAAQMFAFMATGGNFGFDRSVTESCRTTQMKPSVKVEGNSDQPLVTLTFKKRNGSRSDLIMFGIRAGEGVYTLHRFNSPNPRSNSGVLAVNGDKITLTVWNNISLVDNQYAPFLPSHTEMNFTAQ